MTDPRIANLANKVVGKIPQDKPQLNIIVIVEIIVDIVRLYKACKNSDTKRILNMTRRPHLLHRFKVRKIVINNLSKTSSWAGIQSINVTDNVNTIVNAIFGVGAEMSQEDVEMIMNLASELGNASS